MSASPHFSIIIPLYNKEDFVLGSVNSVLNQSFKNFELIVVNDGSTDNSLDRLGEIQSDERVTIVNQENRGRCIARNIGLEKARGEWICFLDADDEFLPGHLDVLKKFGNQRPEAKVMCTKERIGKKILPSGKHKYKTAHFTVKFKDFINENPISINQCAFHSSVVQEFPNERFPISEDWYYLRRITFDHDIWGINEITIRVNDHELRTMHTSNSSDLAKWNMYGADKIIGDLNLPRAQQKRILGFTHLLCANFLLADSNLKSEARKHIKKSFNYFPHNLHILLLKALIKTILK